MSRTDILVGPPADIPELGPPQPLRHTIRRHLPDILAYLIYLCGGLFVTARLWVSPSTRVVAANPTDQSVFDWFLAHGAWFVTHGGNPFYSTRLNGPDGVNLAANTSVLGLSVPLAPVTMVFGPDVSYALLVVLCLAATAASWYWVLSRTLVRNRLAAFVAGALCGFAPGMVSHGNGQPNFLANFLLPLIVYRAALLAQPGRWLRNGIILGLLMGWQALVNEEMLLFTALAAVLFVGVLAALRPHTARRLAPNVARGLLVAGGVSLALLAYPLWQQFFGPQHYHGLPFDPSNYATDPATYFTFSRESVAGSGGVAPRFVNSAAEENGFFGFPLLLLVGIFVGWLWRDHLAVRAATVTGLVFAGLAAGTRLTIHGISTGLPGPFQLLRGLPVLDMVTPTRFTLMTIPLVALVLGLGLQRAGELTPASGSIRHTWLALWTATCLAALIPIVPTPLSARDRTPLPEFFSSGQWRRYVPAGRTVVSAPLASQNYPDPMWWSAHTMLRVAIPAGYFLGPSGADDPHARFGAPPRPTALLLAAVARTGSAVNVDARQRADARADLAFWRAGVVVMAPRARTSEPIGEADGMTGPKGDPEEALWRTVTGLLGQRPVFAGGVWLWRVTG
jgi:hypothetical protein